MKKVWLLLLLIASLLFGGTNAFADSGAPLQGLLRGKPATAPGMVLYKMTDGLMQTYETVGGIAYSWTFARPVDVNGFLFYADSPHAQLHLYDERGVGVAGSGATTTEPTAPFPIQVSGVKTVRLTSADPGTLVKVYELELYGSPSPIVPSTPTGLTAAPSDRAVDLVWNAEPYATGYHVKKSPYSYDGPYSVVQTVYGTSYRDTAVANGIPYYYVVSAFNEFGESPNSQPVWAVPSLRPPAAPLHLTAVPGDGKVMLQWETVTGAVYYNVKRTSGVGGTYTTVGSSVYGYYTDLTATNGTTYSYVFTAVNGAGESAPSTSAAATPYAPAPDRALLVILLNTGAIKEYDLTLAQANAFVAWYDNRASGWGAPGVYPLNRGDNNRGPFAQRTDYIAFPSIVSFEINAYSSE
ncbi:hypothetical protein PV433_05105 [Paenibacillus sp. GYB004]|uniref:fibronectin type III domain-containing protein n=1 Tax=Paenibacillus sp. GYB004 TaxID=2994393 RepID=UPI002F96B57B